MRDDRPSFFSPAVITVFILVFAATAGVVLYATRSKTKEAVPESAAPVPAPAVVKQEQPAEPAPAEVDGGVIDTMVDKMARPEKGKRYKVLVDEMSNGGDAGVARIGGMVTFIKGLREGDVAIVEIYELKRTTADAKVIEKLESRGVTAPAERPPRERAVTRDESSDRPSREREGVSKGIVLEIGSRHTGKIVGTGRDGDGVAYVQDKAVFVTGAKEGETVEFEITADKERFGLAKVVKAGDSTPVESVDAAKPAVEARDEQVVKAQPIQAGEEYEVTITEDDRKNPGVNGVARVKKVVVFVPGLKIGDRAKIRITEVRERTAKAEVIERLQ